MVETISELLDRLAVTPYMTHLVPPEWMALQHNEIQQAPASAAESSNRIPPTAAVVATAGPTPDTSEVSGPFADSEDRPWSDPAHTRRVVSRPSDSESSQECTFPGMRPMPTRKNRYHVLMALADQPTPRDGPKAPGSSVPESESDKPPQPTSK